MTPRAVEMVPILHPAFAGVRIANEIRMQFRRERKSGQTVSLQETLEADGDSALTLADVIQDGFCMEDSCERQEDVRRLRQLLDTLPEKRYDVGIAPHVCDLNDPAVTDLLGRYENAKFINVKDDPIAVLTEIAQCRCILSSCLLYTS
mgnify:CR=1 FL=1